MIGLNLRMTEITACIALQQLRIADQLVNKRVKIAEAIIEAIGPIDGLQHPIVREGCTHVYYAIPFLVGRNRKEFVEAIRAEGVPLVEGYVNPLNRMKAFAKWKWPCSIAEGLHDRKLFYYENCMWDPTEEQIEKIGKAFWKAAERVEI